MLYVCVVFFVLLNLLVAVVNETYILNKQEQKQIEDDLQEEHTHGTTVQRLNSIRPSKQPLLQTAIIRQINRFLQLLFNQSIDLHDNTQRRTHDDDDDDEVSLEEKQNLVIQRLQQILLHDGYNKDVIEKFFQRILPHSDRNDNDDDLFLFQMEENQTLKILYDEFKIFNNQYEKLAQEWRKTAQTARQSILVNTVDFEQASMMSNCLEMLDKRMKKFENLIPKALENIVVLYTNRSSTNQIN